MDIRENLFKLFSLQGKVVLFTGAAGGIGSALSKGLASAGAKVALCDLNMAELAKVEQEITEAGGAAKAFELRLPDMDSIKGCVAKVLETYGQIDVLVNCAGVNVRVGCMDVDEDVYDKITGINLKGAFFLSQEVGRHMIPRKCGSIISFASTNAVNILGGCGVYGTTKSGIASMSRSLAIELAKHNIRATTIAPGAIMTPLSVGYWNDPEKSGFLLNRIALGRPGLPDDLLGLMILLASDASAYMTGSMYMVDGGYLAGGQTWPYDTAY